MKFLCLAYGDEKDWVALTQEERDTLLRRDEELRDKGALMTAVGPDVTTVRAWDGTPTTERRPFPDLQAALAGFAIIEAADVEEAIRLVAATPCARAKGAIEIRRIDVINDTQWSARNSKD